MYQSTYTKKKTKKEPANQVHQENSYYNGGREAVDLEA